MAKFTARKVDLVLELTTLSGEEITMDTSIIPSAENALGIISNWQTIEDSADKDDKKAIVSVLADQLAVIYDKKPEWFLTNLDVGTLSEVVSYVAGALGGIRKNEESSN